MFILYAALCCIYPLAAETSDQPLNLTLGIRIWGMDCSLGFRIAEPLENSPTRLWLAVGGGYEDGYLFRSFAGGDSAGEHTDSGELLDRAAYKNLNLDTVLGISQDLQIGAEHLFSLYLLGTVRYEYRDPAWAPDAFIFDSPTADSSGLFETGLRFGLRFRKKIPPQLVLSTFPLVYKLETSVHLAPLWLGNLIADYSRFSAIGSLLMQLVNARYFELYVATRAGFDLLWGDDLTMYARTTIGGLNPTLFTQRSGLGGAVRGLSNGRFDGTTKAYANLDIRMRIPINAYISPLITVFLDSGVSDYLQLDHTLELSNALYTAGIDFAAEIAGVSQIGYSISYAFNEPDLSRRLAHTFTVGAHF